MGLYNNVTLQYHPNYHNRIAIRHSVVAFPHLHSTQNQTMENLFLLLSSRDNFCVVQTLFPLQSIDCKYRSAIHYG